jgi:hypothetical protein
MVGRIEPHERQGTATPGPEPLLEPSACYLAGVSGPGPEGLQPLSALFQGCARDCFRAVFEIAVVIR